MSFNELAQELVQIQKELTPIQEDIYAFLNQKDEIPIYKIEHVIPFMMYRYCQLINQQVDANRRLDMLVTMQAAKERYDEKAHEEEEEKEEEEEEEECQVSKEEKIKTEEEYKEMIEELDYDEEILAKLAHDIESFVNEKGHISHWKITTMLRKFTNFIETRNEMANKIKILNKYRKDNEYKTNLDECLEKKKKKEPKYIKMISTDSYDSPFNFSSDDNEKEEDEEKKEEKEKEEEKEQKK